MLKLFMSKSQEYELNEQEIVVLAILNGLYSKKQEMLVTSIESIGYMACGRFLTKKEKRDRTICENIRIGIQSLADSGIIKILDQDGDNYVFANDGLEVDTEKENFVVVELWEMQRIFSQANKPFAVFSFFVNIVGTINNTTKEWHMPQDDMAASWNSSKRTVNSYLEQLEEMKLIYVYRHKKRRTDGTYQKLNNSYGRYSDKEDIIKVAQEYASFVECEDFLERIDRRAIKLRYNAFCNGAKKYNDNPDAAVALFKECKLYNKSLKSNPVEGVYDGEWKQGEPLDLSVFPDDIEAMQNQRDATDQWGEPDPMEKNIPVEDNAPVVCEVS